MAAPGGPGRARLEPPRQRLVPRRRAAARDAARMTCTELRAPVRASHAAMHSRAPATSLRLSQCAAVRGGFVRGGVPAAARSRVAKPSSELPWLELAAGYRTPTRP